ncbi:hypothetical protein ABIC56_001379 [Acinetobacter bereziniae]|uniref:hypothetical protein n=1 Tax=Acinetobacter bereziniae TaxID=106648 RepID=UPI0021E4BA8E|nr:hypothetical protein [Acinetobacter bereziniae]MCV2442992.1 hypothetical protein [Acinetobacter bereziniae]MDR6540891.1 hypothetical protein [Acinetobacter bereziniae]
MSFVIPVWVDYGAIEVLWYSPFDNMEIIISWWEDQESIDIYINIKQTSKLLKRFFPME